MSIMFQTQEKEGLSYIEPLPCTHPLYELREILAQFMAAARYSARRIYYAVLPG